MRSTRSEIILKTRDLNKEGNLIWSRQIGLERVYTVKNQHGIAIFIPDYDPSALLMYKLTTRKTCGSGRFIYFHYGM